MVVTSMTKVFWSKSQVAVEADHWKPRFPGMRQYFPFVQSTECQRNYFTIFFFCTLRQSRIFIPGIKNDLCVAVHRG